MLFLCFSKALSVRIWDLYLFYGFEIFIHSSVSVLQVFSRRLDIANEFRQAIKAFV